jgi:hypothetical protein
MRRFAAGAIDALRCVEKEMDWKMEGFEGRPRDGEMRRFERISSVGAARSIQKHYGSGSNLRLQIIASGMGLCC